MLSIMDEIDSFCRCNGITYFLIGGSLLGAIRHKGFIPWDDDMDIGLPRKDYNRLLREFRSSSGNVELNCYETKSHYKWANAKAIDTRTILFEAGDLKHPTGVFVDIFPFDGIAGDRDTAERKTMGKKRWNDVLSIKHLRVDSKRSFFKNLIIIIGKLLLWIIPDKTIIRMINSSEKDPLDFHQSDYVERLHPQL